MTDVEWISLILSPFVSAILTAILTYRFAIKSRRVDILYENKIPAFKEIAFKITQFKNFCTGRAAYFQGNEYSPFYEEGFGALRHRTEIANSFSTNGIFLNKNSRFLITELLIDMSGLCNAEAAMAGGDNELNPQNEYERMSIIAESIIDILYRELNLIKN